MTERIWSSEQLAIFDAIENGEGHRVIQARAGCAKSTTALEGILRARKSARHKNSAIVYLAFNKVIATEFEPRVEGAAEVMTTHSLGNRIVNRAWGKQHVAQRTFNIAKRLVGFRNRQERRWEAGTWQKANLAKSETTYGIAKLVDHAKDSLCSDVQTVADLILPFGLFVEPYLPHEAAEIALAIMEECRQPSGQIDFADMIWLPTVCNMPSTKYDLVFVDEAQDLNRAQLALVQRACAPRNGRIIIIGDSKQAIYAWRGADPEAMPRMERELKAKVLTLTTTYRCPKKVVALAQVYVPDFKAAPNAAEGVVEKKSWEQMLDEVEPSEVILSRTNAPLVTACLGFLREGRRAFIRGRDVGAELKSLVWRSKKPDIDGMLVWLRKWQERELNKLIDAGKNGIAKDRITDTFDTLVALTEGLDEVSGLTDRLDKLFEDSGTDEDRILLSSTHRFKGLEADTVWMLRDTYMRTWRDRDGNETQVSEEEENIYYVAVTRSMRVLKFVYMDAEKASTKPPSRLQRKPKVERLDAGRRDEEEVE